MDNERVTIKEISEKLNMSPTSVSRALTGKKKISDEKRALVIQTAKEMGYKPNSLARAFVKNGINIGVILAEEPFEYTTYLKKGVEKAAGELSDFKVKCSFHFFHDNLAMDEINAALQVVYNGNFDGLIFAPAFGYSAYYQTVYDIANKKNIPILFIAQTMGDIKGIACIKTDARVMGKMAAEFLSICLPKGSAVAVITTNKDFEHHSEILKAFSAAVAEENHLEIKKVVENQDSKQVSYLLTEQLVQSIPDIKGIYVTSYNSVSVCKCLENLGMAKDIVVIGHDLYPELAHYLENGNLKATLFQDPLNQGKMAVHTMYNYLIKKKAVLGDVIIKPQLILKSNMESYDKEY
ncbi:MAG: LacI family DNA-binding transcriptional regulator [Eubacteriales bacterium]|nr:LacI family DNA-binding transcriptional regulator [Eubacteriales bacterium]